MCCDDHKACRNGFYCEEVKNDQCENWCRPWYGSEQICDDDHECKDGVLKFCSEDNCSQGSDKDAKCCGGTNVRQKMIFIVNIFLFII